MKRSFTVVDLYCSGSVQFKRHEQADLGPRLFNLVVALDVQNKKVMRRVKATSGIGLLLEQSRTA